jgi:hypothetical protein
MKKLFCKIFGCKTKRFIVTETRGEITTYRIIGYQTENASYGYYQFYEKCLRCGKDL